MPFISKVAMKIELNMRFCHSADFGGTHYFIIEK